LIWISTLAIRPTFGGFSAAEWPWYRTRAEFDSLIRMALLPVSPNFDPAKQWPTSKIEML
jgi:hypothetical protein